MEKRSFVAVIGAIMLMTAPATAQTHMQMPSFGTLDTNNTGALTPEAFEAGVQRHRDAALDQNVERLMSHANDDGLLDATGLRAGLAEMHKRPRTDRRADKVTRLFSRLDTNKDGVIDAEEYARMTRMISRRGQH
jgi:Ca2+-binding EF-hand superfamily protein